MSLSYKYVSLCSISRTNGERVIKCDKKKGPISLKNYIDFECEPCICFD